MVMVLVEIVGGGFGCGALRGVGSGNCFSN